MKGFWSRYRGYLLSLLIHLSLLLFFANVQLIPTVITEEGVKIEWVDLNEESTKDEKLKRRQIVEQDEIPVNNDTPLDNYKLSRNDQRVFEETKAKNHGDFKNSKGDGDNKAAVALQGSDAAEPTEPNQSPTKNESKAPKAVAKKFSFSDFAPKTVQAPSLRKPSARLVSAGSGQAGSATDDYLKDIKTGTQTLLNTREFIYYSYYNRIKSKLKQQWEPKIKGKITRILQQGRTISSLQDKITRLVITLDRSGELVKIQVRGRSGYHELDEAAIDAFRAAAPFPNPPEGIADRLGEIKINWDFVLES